MDTAGLDALNRAARDASRQMARSSTAARNACCTVPRAVAVAMPAPALAPV